MQLGRLLTANLIVVVLATISGEAAACAVSQTSTNSAHIGGGPVISNIVANSDTVGRYEKFEVTFDISETTAINPQFPYDPDPPTGVPAALGITVDGLFSNDDWATTTVQPAFLYQGYEHRRISWAGVEDRDWLYPEGDPVWKVRFAPQGTGAWQYRIRATDASGTTESAPGSFTVVDSSSSGFVRLSPADPRYFEFSDGSPFVGVGHNEGFNADRFTADVDAKFATFEAYRVNFFRVWMNASSVVGSAWAPWSSHHLPYEGGYLPASSLSSEQGYMGQPFSLKLSQANPCMFTGPVSVQPNTTYRIMARVRAADLNGTGDYGFVVKTAYWLGQACADSANGEVLLGPVSETSGLDGWQEIASEFTTSGEDSFFYSLYLALEDVSSGTIYVDEVSIREVVGEGEYGAEILPKNAFNYHLYFDQAASWRWDYVFDKATGLGIYLKPVVLEKNDWLYNHIDLDGTPLEDDAGYDNNLFYATPDTAVRRLHEYYWRYLAARWGYSTAVHSWELLNEGDPFNGNHYDQADSFAGYIDAHDPSQHLVTTSNWHSFPAAEFWGGASYPHLDYADLHAYISTGRGLYEWNPPAGTMLETNPLHARGGQGGSLRVPAGRDSPNGDEHMSVRGKGTWTVSVWMNVQDYEGSCPYGMPSTMAGPQLVVWLEDVGTRVIPYDPSDPDKYYVCTNEFTGTEGWARFSGVVEIPDDEYHTLGVGFKTHFSDTGTAWFDDLRVTSPDGRTLRIFGNGTFDDRQRMDHDTALYTDVYSGLDGATSLSGAGKPVVRGEAGIDHAGGPQTELLELTDDTEGVWLHNYTWGLVNPGGMYELYWWVENIRNHNLYPVYKPFRDFMDGVPLNNGNYVDAEARTSNAGLRAWGQKDPVGGRAHLWIQNEHHTWFNVVSEVPIAPLDGTITMSGFQSGTVEAVWWDPYAGTVISVEIIPVGPSGVVTLSVSGLETDTACHIRQEDDSQWAYQMYVPMTVG
jgi:hypothetical protein